MAAECQECEGKNANPVLNISISLPYADDLMFVIRGKYVNAVVDLMQGRLKVVNN